MGNKTITELYASLCAKSRRLERTEPLCKRCYALYSAHPASKCPNDLGNFEATDAVERATVRESIQLIEKLFEINGWEI